MGHSEQMAATTDAILPADAEGTMPFEGGHTWYRVNGDLRGGVTPLVVAHGGPGATSDYLLQLTALASPHRGGRPVVLYDQFGNGRSTHRPDADPSFWSVQLFLDELDALLAHLGIADGYHLLGQSWGGMLGAEHAIRTPAGLQRLVIANSPASMKLWLEAANGLRASLPPEVDQVLRHHEAADTTASPEYAAAMQVFYDRHVCRVVPNPPEVTASFAAIESDPTVYHTMNGPSEFHTIGSLVTWSVVDRLTAVAVPTLLISGEYDEAQPVCVQPFADLIPDVRWRVFEDSSHMPHVEQTAAYLDVVAAFLAGGEPAGTDSTLP